MRIDEKTLLINLIAHRTTFSETTISKKQGTALAVRILNPLLLNSVSAPESIFDTWHKRILRAVFAWELSDKLRLCFCFVAQFRETPQILLEHVQCGTISSSPESACDVLYRHCKKIPRSPAGWYTATPGDRPSSDTEELWRCYPFRRLLRRLLLHLDTLRRLYGVYMGDSGYHPTITVIGCNWTVHELSELLREKRFSELNFVSTRVLTVHKMK